MKHWKKAAASLSAALLLTGLFSGCAKTEEAVMDNRVVVNTQTADIGSVALTTTYIGSLAAENTVYVIPKVSGTVEEVYVQVGDTVAEGDALCKFDDSAAKLTLNTAYASYNAAAAQREATLGSSWDLQSFQTQTSIDSAMSTLNQLYESQDAVQAQMASTQIAKDAAAVRLELAQSQLVSSLMSVSTDDMDYLNIISRTADQIASLDMSVSAEDFTNKIGNILSNATMDVDVSLLDAPGIAAQYDALSAAAQNYQENASALQSLTASYAQLETSIDAAETGLHNAQKMQSMTEHDVRESTEKTLNKSLATAQAGVDSARYQVNLYKVTAPVSGVVQSVAVTPNNMFATGSAAFVIANGDGKQLTFYVTEAVAAQLEIGQAVQAVYADKAYDGTVTEVGNAADLTKGLFKVKANLTDAESLPNGISMKLTTVTDRSNDRIAVPCDAVRYSGGRSYLYLDDNGVARQVEVTTGIYDDNNIVILSGIQKGDKIVTTWSANLIDGAVLVEAG